ncbi:MAG: hypothetical protein AAFP26_08235 [Planctomycetota bacterium]
MEWAHRAASYGRDIHTASGHAGLRQYEDACGPFCAEVFGMRPDELEDRTIIHPYAQVASEWLSSTGA